MTARCGRRHVDCVRRARGGPCDDHEAAVTSRTARTRTRLRRSRRPLRPAQVFGVAAAVRWTHHRRTTSGQSAEAGTPRWSQSGATSGLTVAAHDVAAAAATTECRRCGNDAATGSRRNDVTADECEGNCTSVNSDLCAYSTMHDVVATLRLARWLNE